MESCVFLICGRGTNGQPLIPARRVGESLYPPKDFRAWANRPTWPTPRHGKPSCKVATGVFDDMPVLPMRVQALTGPYARVWHQVPAWAGSGIQPHSTPQDVLRIALETSRGETQWNCFPAQI